LFFLGIAAALCAADPFNVNDRCMTCMTAITEARIAPLPKA
jgi:hypothetical protein